MRPVIIGALLIVLSNAVAIALFFNEEITEWWEREKEFTRRYNEWERKHGRERQGGKASW